MVQDAAVGGLDHRLDREGMTRNSQADDRDRSTPPHGACCAGGVFFRRHKPTIIALLLPLDVEDPGTAVVMGICERCALKEGWPRPGWRGAVLARIMPELRKVWPGCRLVTPTPGLAGTA
jgi:hypothetical protein